MTEIDAELATLRETAARCSRKVHIGAAVLPKPLFVPDHDDTLVAADDKNGTDMEGVRESGDRKKWPLIKCATVSTVPPEDDPSFSPAARRRPPTRYARVLAAEFDTLVVEHHLKWSPLVHDLPGPIGEDAPPTSRLGRYDFHHVDSMVDFAQRHGMEVKGHVLVWHVTSPPFLENMAPEEVREAVKRHIFTTMAYFRVRWRLRLSSPSPFALIPCSPSLVAPYFVCFALSQCIISISYLGYVFLLHAMLELWHPSCTSS